MNDQTSDGKARSPLKEAPLRVPGQSLDDERDRLVDDVVLPYLWRTENINGLAR